MSSEDLLPVEEILNTVSDHTPGALPWPASMPGEGKVYGFVCPVTGAKMVAMLETTFLGLGTDMERMRRAGRDIEKRCQELKQERDTAAALLSEMQKRHANLRSHLKADRLARLEKKADPIRAAIEQATTGRDPK